MTQRPAPAAEAAWKRWFARPCTCSSKPCWASCVPTTAMSSPGPTRSSAASCWICSAASCWICFGPLCSGPIAALLTPWRSRGLWEDAGPTVASSVATVGPGHRRPRSHTHTSLGARLFSAHTKMHARSLSRPVAGARQREELLRSCLPRTRAGTLASSYPLGGPAAAGGGLRWVGSSFRPAPGTRTPPPGPLWGQALRTGTAQLRRGQGSALLQRPHPLQGCGHRQDG
jgi:hypothetical protein